MFDLSNIKLSKNDIKRNLTLPIAPSRELAEFLGILTGDGYINYYPYQYKYILEIAGDSRFDEVYLKSYVNRLIKELFNLESSYYKRKNQNSLYLRIISKGLINYLILVGFKKGKKDQIMIPKWIKGDKLYMRCFLRGFADTDGSLHFRKNYPIISLSSKSSPLIHSIFLFLKKEGFSLKNYYKEIKIDKRGYNPSCSYYINLNGRRNLRFWMSIIRFSNEKHKRKLVGNGNAEI